MIGLRGQKVECFLLLPLLPLPPLLVLSLSPLLPHSQHISTSLSRGTVVVLWCAVPCRVLWAMYWHDHVRGCLYELVIVRFNANVCMAENVYVCVCTVYVVRVIACWISEFGIIVRICFVDRIISKIVKFINFQNLKCDISSISIPAMEIQISIVSPSFRYSFSSTANQMCDIIYFVYTPVWRQRQYAHQSVHWFTCLASGKLAFWVYSVHLASPCIWECPKKIQKHLINDWVCCLASVFWRATHLDLFWIWLFRLNHKSWSPHWSAPASYSFRWVVRHCWRDVAVSYFWVASLWPWWT